MQEITASLRSRQQLLLLDNCEHVLAETAPLVSHVLAACPAVQVLATSRSPLRVHGEHELAIEPLPLPVDDAHVDGEVLWTNAAVRLFVVHAIAPGVLSELDPLLSQQRIYWTTVPEIVRDLLRWYRGHEQQTTLRNTLVGDLFHLLVGFCGLELPDNRDRSRLP